MRQDNLLLLAPLALGALSCARTGLRGEALPDVADAELAAVTEWIAANEARLSTVEPGADHTDLEPLRTIVGDARIVHLGEPTHGNREISQLRSRMVRFLVEEMGFTAVVVEMPMAEAFDVNQYIAGGAGTPETALAATHVWPFDHRVMADLIAWMQRENQRSDRARSLSFYGFDVQSCERAARRTIEYLERVDPARGAAAREAIGHLAISFSDPDAFGYRPIVDRDFDDAVHSAVASVEDAFDTNREAWSGATAPDEWALARQHARLLGQAIETNRGDASHSGAVRDRSMAENVRWLLEREGPDARIVVWAHNCHLEDAMSYHMPDPFPMAGRHLRGMFGDDLRIIGFFFDRGSFTAIDEADPARGIRSYGVGPARADTLEARFADAGAPIALLDLRALPDEGPVADWFLGPQPTRFSWGGYDPAAPENYITHDVFTRQYDALAFVTESTPTRMVEPADYGAVPVLTEPVNLDFEQGVAGDVPGGWIAWSKQRRFGFEVTTAENGAAQGQRAAVIRRRPEDEIGEASGSLIQFIDAAPYRGRRVRLRARVRAELADGCAFLRLRTIPRDSADLHGFEAPPEDVIDTLDAHRVTSPDWTTLEIIADVPDTAGQLAFGLYLAGNGEAWLDDVTLALPPD